MDRTQKQAVVSSLQARFQDAGCVVVSHYRGLTVTEMDDLRSKMREAGAEIEVAKNRLVKLALADTPYTGLSDMFTGPTIVATSSDPIAAAKAAHSFAKDNEIFAILGGGMGEQVLDANGVKALASLPSLDELRAKLVGLLQAPAQQLATVSQAPASQLARLMTLKPEAAAA